MGHTNIQQTNLQSISSIKPQKLAPELEKTAFYNNNSIKNLKTLEIPKMIKNPKTLEHPKTLENPNYPKNDKSDLPANEKLQIIWALSFTFKNIPTQKLTEIAESFNYDKNKLFSHYKTEIENSGYDESCYTTVTRNPRKCRFCQKRYRNEVMQNLHEKDVHKKRWQRMNDGRDARIGFKKEFKRGVEFY